MAVRAGRRIDVERTRDADLAVVDRQLHRVAAADELGAELGCRHLVQIGRGRDLFDTPAFMTATRSAMAIASDWSWVT
jgi:hypothetical protein